MAVSKKLLEEAQSIMDAYFQDFAPDDAFFRLEDFAIWLGKAYGKVADDVAKEIYKTSLAETGTGLLTFSQDWWARKEIDVDNNEEELSACINFKFIGFTYDSQTSGIQELMPIGKKGNCGTYIRTTITELWILKNMSKSDIVYWYIDSDKLRFKVNSGCNPKKIAVYYIPSVEDDNFKLPSSKAFDIATMAYNFMQSAKKETPFVDTTNNSNPNIAPPLEVDSKQAKPIGT